MCGKSMVSLFCERGIRFTAGDWGRTSDTTECAFCTDWAPGSHSLRSRKWPPIVPPTLLRCSPITQNPPAPCNLLLMDVVIE
uniref:Uncharacterized protein n=1 Tax=Anguilla anguilla TaxID=7936 RepID=A0A0E9XH98_ANGAN